MGNCLVLEEKEGIKIKRMEGQILKYDSPLKVPQALPKFPGHTISDGIPATRNINQMAGKQNGHLYHLQRSKKMQTKETGAVRIKLVISKQELKEILEKEGLTLEDIMSQIQKEPRYSHKREKERSVMWKPALESISEVNDLY